MNSKKRNKEIKRIATKTLIYILISIPLAYLLWQVMELKYTVIFWTYIAVMGISSLFAEFYIHVPNEEKSNFGKIIEHIAFICFITLMFSYFYGLYKTPL